MFDNLTVFQTAGKMAAHAGRRQAILSQNVANADTPGYRALDLPDFAKSVRLDRHSADLRATRASHLQGRPDSNGPGFGVAAEIFERAGPTDPNGNSVALDQELMYAVEARRDHDRALAIYRSALGILRTSIQTR